MVEWKLAVAATVLAACACSDKPVSVPVAPPVVAPVAPSEPPAPRATAPREVRMPEPGSARDDLPHLRKQLEWLARVGDCLPQDKDLTIALDAYDNRLVACVQVMTRRDVSVQSDAVNYACWNVDPATGNVTKRSDLGRDYFRCQDGACPVGFPTTRWVSHDGAYEVVAGGAQRRPPYNDPGGVGEVSIVRRGGAPVRTMKVAHEGEGNMRDSFTLVGPSLIHMDQSNGSVVRILDERGAQRGTEVPGIEVHVVDAGHVLVSPHEGDHTLVELATNKRTTVIRGADYLSTMVRFAGAFYAVDSDARRLVALDGKTLQPQRTLPLRTCPLPP